MEYLTIKVLRSEFEANKALFSNVEYKELSFKDDFFKGDEMHKALKKVSDKAYIQLKKYEHLKRNK